MSLSPGVRLGAYEVVALIGAGGMGEVYRARDLTLNREVALKRLPESFSGDAERVARFRREAQLLAALNHPNIAQIHGFEESAAGPALVMELVEGWTLADHIAHGPMPVETALPIARQIAEALEAAHEHGIVHRDLKPANVKVRDDGTVKVLDFGLAKAFDPVGSTGTKLAQSPTLTLAATQAGVVLGTAAYMSPEQARGKIVDKRSDIWAFGCVLYEMLTGRRAFVGDEVSDVLARIIEREPDWNALPPTLPAAVRRLLRRSLEKDRKRRLTDIADARLEIDEALAGPQPDDAAAREKRGARPGVSRAAAAAFMAAALVLAGAVVYLLRPGDAPAAARLNVMLPENTRFQVAGGPFGAPAGNSGTISPDGRTVLMTLDEGAGRWRMWIRALDSLTARPLRETDGANSPFWSPDSRYIAFFAGGKLKKIDIIGGSPQTVCDAPAGRGGSWNLDNVIVFAPSNQQPLFRVSAAGGEPTPATRLQPGETWHRSPSFLPDARHFLYRAQGSAPGIFVGTLDSDEVTRLRDADSNAIYAPPGYVLFVRQATLMAQAFDARRLGLSGEAMPVAENVVTDLANGLSAFAVSDNGVLTYRTGGIRTVNFQMAWFDRDGNQLEMVGAPGPYRGVDVSRDGTHVAVHRHDIVGGDVWLLEPTRGTSSRFTFDASQDNGAPVWSPDAGSVAFASLRDRKWGVYRKSFSNPGTEERLLEADTPTAPMSWSPDGLSIMYEAVDSKTGNDLWLLPLSGDRKPVPWLRTSFAEGRGQISPDGRWLAYQSDESGRPEIYVTSFPQGGEKWPISAGGGFSPRWRGDTRELFYTTQTSAGWNMMAVDVKPDGTTLQAASPRALFDFQNVGVTHSAPYQQYAVSADGQRFLIPRTSAEELAASITVVLNWWAGLAK